MVPRNGTHVSLCLYLPDLNLYSAGLPHALGTQLMLPHFAHGYAPVSLTRQTAGF